MGFGKSKTPKVPPPPPPVQRADAGQDLSSGGSVRSAGVSGMEPSLIVQALQSKSGAQRKRTLGSA